MDPSTRSYFYELGKAHADVDPVRDAEITKIVRQALKKLAAESGSTDSPTALGVHPKDAKSVSGDAPRGTGSTFAVPGSINDDTRPENGCA